MTATTIQKGSSRFNGVLLGVSNVIDMGVQFLLPIMLSRLLDAVGFGEYRAFWLVVGTAVAVAPWGIPASLFYFLPRNQSQAKVTYLLQAGILLAAVGLVTMASVFAAQRLSLIQLPSTWVLPVFCGLWVFSSLLDVACVAMQQVRRQTLLNVTVSVARLSIVLGIAWMTRSVEATLLAHVVLGLLRAGLVVGVLSGVMRTTSGWRSQPWAWSAQIKYAIPFGASTALYGVRSKIDQWIVVHFFSSSVFGAYSLASIFSPIQGLVRSTVTSLTLPEINRLHEADDLHGAHELNRRANVGVAALMFPIAVFLFAAATTLVHAVFGASYEVADTVIRPP